MKIWYKSKVVWLAIIQAIIGVVVVLGTQYPEIGYVAIGKSVLDILLRLITELPVGFKRV